MFEPQFRSTERLLRIRSTTRTSGNSSDFYTPTRDMKGTWKVESVVLPNTAYNIRTGVNSSMYLTVNAVVADVNLTEGFYTASTLATHASAVINAVPSISSVTVTYSSATGKMTVAHATLDIVMTSAPAIGFTTSQAAATSIVGDAVVVLRTTDVYNIFLDGAEGENRTNCAFMVENNVNSNEFIHHRSSDQYAQFVNFRNSTNTLHVTLKDDTGVAISVNGAEWSFVLSKTGGEKDL